MAMALFYVRISKREERRRDEEKDGRWERGG